jgi:hypothetical protein
MLETLPRKSLTPLTISLFVAGAVFLVGLAILCARWPFRPQSVLADLQEVSMSKVQFGAFHGTYFPRPGCVLEHVVFQHNPKPGAPPFIVVEKITIEGNFFGLFTRHVRSVRLQGLRILIPPRGSGEHFNTPKRSTVVIDELTANGGVLEVASRDPKRQPLRFAFHDFALRDVGGNGPATFKARLTNPEPPGEISTQGKFGPWNSEDLGKTPVSGSYLFEQANLGVFRAIAGTLSSAGSFEGALEHISVQGTTDVPNFTVASNAHPAALQTHFQAAVNAKNGDTFLQNVTAHFWKTTLASEGSVAGHGVDPGKMTSLAIGSRDGRIEDLLGLFTHSKQAPMSGSVSFKAKVMIPPGRIAFLEKVELQGDFGIDDGKFTKSDTQAGVNRLSEGARGEKNYFKDESDQTGGRTVLSDLKGHVVLKGGTASFSSLSFSIPGANAEMHGTYNLISEKIDLHGTLRTDAELSKTTHGMKALVLKVLDPFFKKHKAGYAAPVKITGTYDHPSFGLEITGTDHKPQQAIKK